MMTIEEIKKAMSNGKTESDYTIRQQHNDKCKRIIEENKNDKQKLRTLLSEAEADYARYYVNKNHADAVKRIHTNNYKYLVVEEVFKYFMEIFNKYSGKKAGEKTTAKFQNEITEVCGNIGNIYIENSYSTGEITIYTNVCNSIKIYCNYVPDAPESRQFFDKENKFVTVSDEWFTNPYSYIEDVEGYIQEAEKALKEAKAAGEAYKSAMSKYNSIAKGGEVFNEMNNNNAHYVNIV